MKTIHACILSGLGINCEEETFAACRLAGASPQIVHLSKLLQETVSLLDFQMLIIPGGFSFGDELGSGKRMANRLKYGKTVSGKSLFEEVLSFYKQGGLILGICNGFQVLVKSGLLPNISGNFEQEVTLTTNQSGHFEDRWVKTLWNEECVAPMGKNSGEIPLPVRHKEGQLKTSEKIFQEMIEKKMIMTQFLDENHQPTENYPQNPNGSFKGITGICSPCGRIMGLMPHPEAFLIPQNHPEHKAEKTGLNLFQNLINFLKGDLS